MARNPAGIAKPELGKGSSEKRLLKNRRVRTYLLILGIVILFAAAAVFLKVQKQSIPQDANAECSQDSDCMKVQTTCCNCASGGSEICTSSSRAEELRAKNCGTDYSCISLYACKIQSCFCNAGTCAGIDIQE